MDSTQLVELVWARADRCCEYCRTPQDQEALVAEIDHVIAEVHGGLQVAFDRFAMSYQPLGASPRFG